MEFLPDELLVHIFSYLPIIYRTRVMHLVCKRFHSLCQITSLRRTNVYRDLYFCNEYLLQKAIQEGSFRLKDCSVKSVHMMNQVLSSQSGLKDLSLENVRFLDTDNPSLKIHRLKSLKTLHVESKLIYKKYMSRDLTQLHLHYQSKLADFPTLPLIKVLSIWVIQQNCLQYLDKFPNVERLSLKMITTLRGLPTSLSALPRMEQLVYLKIDGAEFVDPSELTHLSRLPNLKELRLSECTLNSFMFLPPLQQLARVSVGFARVYYNVTCNYHGLDRCPRLAYLELDIPNIVLSIHQTNLIERIPDLPQLTHLKIKEHPCDDSIRYGYFLEGYDYLRKVPNLVSLHLISTISRFEERDKLGPFPLLPKLREFTLSQYRVSSGHDLRYLESFPNLVILCLSNCFFSTLKALPILQHLEVLEIGVTDYKPFCLETDHFPEDFFPIANLLKLRSLGICARSLHKVVSNLPRPLTSLKTISLICETWDEIIQDMHQQVIILCDEVVPNITHIKVVTRKRGCTETNILRDGENENSVKCQRSHVQDVEIVYESNMGL